MRLRPALPSSFAVVLATLVAVAAHAASPALAPVLVPGGPAPTRADVGPRTLSVGPAGEFATPSAAAAAARDGDIVQIGSGDYRGDVAVWSANRLRIVGADPRPHLMAEGRDAQGKAIWVVRGDDVIIENVEMSGARVPDRNGAAIRVEGRNLTVRNGYFHDNENGLLTGVSPGSTITIERCEFARNGGGEGYTHNLYVGAVARLVVKQSWFHHAIGGHNLKSRAQASVITDSRFADEADGRSSYGAEFPNGGQVTLAFNIFQKGASSENTTLVSYGAEGLNPDAKNEFVARGNTFIGQRPGGTRFLFIAPGAAANLIGNVFAGPGQLPDVPGVRANNAVQRDLPGNVDLKPEGFR